MAIKYHFSDAFDLPYISPTKARSTDVLGFVMAGGKGSRLKVLTKDKCKPAVGIFGRYKIFDFVASNLTLTANSGTEMVEAHEIRAF